jgi:hypothetical protein
MYIQKQHSHSAKEPSFITPKNTSNAFQIHLRRLLHTQKLLERDKRLPYLLKPAPYQAPGGRFPSLYRVEAFRLDPM